MALIPDEVITEIRDRADVVAIIGEHVQLKKAGASWKGLCPFHNEKTPSFHVSPARRAFYCFGCQKKGDVFGFLMELEGKSFVEVAKDLGRRTGVAIPERPPTPEERARQSERSRLCDVNTAAASYYRELLLDETAGEKGRRYLASRTIGDEVAETFRLGLAPEGWDGLCRRLEARKVPAPLAVTLGLIAPRQSGRGHYDRFRDRLMCPVILPAGEVVGFSGRTLGVDPDAPKYFNSPESPIYKKSHLLFGLHAARESFRRRGRALLVEGNFDVIALHQAGFTETVAPLGTALTEHQVELLRRLAPQVVLCLDGDRAGREAALKSIVLLTAGGVEARVVALPDGEDPDSFVRKQGAAALEGLVAAAQPAVEYFLDRVWYRSDRSADSLARALREAAPLIAGVADEIKREIIIGQFATALNVQQAVVRKAMAQATSAAPSPDRTVTPGPKGPPPPAQELRILAILADHPHLLRDSERLDVRSLLTDGRLRDMYSAALAGTPFVDAAPRELSDVIAREVFAGSYMALEDPAKTLADAVRTLGNERVLAEADELGRQAKEAERRGDTARARELAMLQVQAKTRSKARR